MEVCLILTVILLTHLIRGFLIGVAFQGLEYADDSLAQWSCLGLCRVGTDIEKVVWYEA